MVELAAAPLLCALMVGLLVLLFIPNLKIQRLIHIIGAIVYLLIVVGLFSIIQNKGLIKLQVGGYPSGIAISLAIDSFSGLMLLVTAIIALATAIYSLNDKTISDSNIFYPAFWFLLCGVTGAFITTDLFNLYVWFEVMIMASFILMVLSNDNHVFNGALYYIGLNILATMVMLVAISFLYGLSGTLDMAEMTSWFKETSPSSYIFAVIGLLMMAFAIKSAIFPYCFWLPDSYPLTSITAVSFFAGLLTKVGIYALIRISSLFFAPQSYLIEILLVASCLTMIGGVFGAMSDFHIRRILSFHIVSQVGYMSLALSMSTTIALTAGIFYIVHHIIVKTNLFLIAGVISCYNGQVDLRRMGNIFAENSLLGLLFLIPALSLAGMPPFSGFWAKLLILQAAFTDGFYISAAIAIIVGFFTLYSMIKIWRYAFLQPNASSSQKPVMSKAYFYYLPIIGLAGVTLFIGLFPDILYTAAHDAAEMLLQKK